MSRGTADRRRAAQRPSNDQGEPFERDPKTGEKTDAAIWDAMLDGDTRDTYDLMDPESQARWRRTWEGPVPRAAPAPAGSDESPYVVFLLTTDTGQEPMGRAFLRDGGVVFEGLDPAIADEAPRAIRVGRRTVTLADGDRFLRALPVKFNGSYWRAAYHGRAPRAARRRARPTP